MKVLVCGGREFWDGARVYAVLDALHFMSKIEAVIHGAARGADTLAGAWARDHDVQEIAVPADWKRHGKSAGPIRNKQMLDDHQPDVILAFPGGPGTNHMVTIARDYVVRRAHIGPHGVLDLRMNP